MASRSAKDTLLYKQFKKEVTIVNLTSKVTGKKIAVIKWRGQILQTGNIQQAFIKAKEIMIKTV